MKKLKYIGKETLPRVKGIHGSDYRIEEDGSVSPEFDDETADDLVKYCGEAWAFAECEDGAECADDKCDLPAKKAAPEKKAAVKEAPSKKPAPKKASKKPSKKK